MTRGYFGIGILDAKKGTNVGTLLRSAMAFGADFCFTVGTRYKKDKSNTPKAERHMPLWEFGDFAAFQKVKPKGCKLIGIEYQENNSIVNFVHPERGIYLLGAEDYGLPLDILDQCDYTVSIPSKLCLNVSVSGSIIICDRVCKAISRKEYI
jgi:tRNA G18 (ribose-2'-O)-methylase SpoU